MNDEHLGSRLAALLRTLKPKTKEPVSAKVLNTWCLAPRILVQLV